MRPVSKKRQKRDRPYNQARQDLYEAAEGFCQANCNTDCNVWGEQVHHKAGRTGKNPHALDNLLLVCEPCHRHIHGNPELSYANGWMVRRNRGNDE